MSKPRDYLAAIESLNTFQTKWQNNGTNGPNKLLEMKKYLQRCNIQLEVLDKLSVIHVTGTHGKGSTCAYCESILQNHGYKTGFFSSPHLLEVRERIRINGKPVSKWEFAKYFWQVHEKLDRQKEHDKNMPLYFKLLTTLAFYIFLEKKVDVAIIEVGIGGEYDCTNIIRNPIAVGITPVGIDHTAILGKTVETIAWHKGGIMKEGCSAFTVEQLDNVLNVLTERSKERKCNLKVVKHDICMVENGSKIPPHIKKTNASLAIALSKAFMEKKPNKTGQKFSYDLAVRSVEKTCWNGRYEIKQVKNLRFFLDCAHTVESIKCCAEWFLEETRHSSIKKALIFNVTGERDVEVFLKQLYKCRFDVVLFTPNVADEKETTDTANYKLTVNTQLKRCETYKNIWSSLQYDGKECVRVLPSLTKAMLCLGEIQEYDVLITGSLYLIGAALSILNPSLNEQLKD